MTTILSKIEKLKAMRNAASPGPWEIQLEDREETIWLDSARENTPTIHDLNFIEASASKWTNILEALRLAVDGLEHCSKYSSDHNEDTDTAIDALAAIDEMLGGVK